mgnify:CR=1 FL=1
MMKCIKPLIVKCLIFCTSIAYAQEYILQGNVVLEGTNSPIAGVVVSAQLEKGGSILSYAMTDESGSFSLLLPKNIDGFYVTASSMMTESVTLLVSSRETKIFIQVKEKRMTLKDAKIQAPKVSISGDTLNYNVSSYVKVDDRNIGEVLKRIPGVTVTSEGEIYYQNSQINKFYVEGMDLLQGRYGLASNNIDPTKVATIQVLENHQPIRVLEETEIPQQAAINLKLKKSAMGAFFLTSQIGLGLNPILYSNEILGMRFTQTQQNLIMYKDDNTGHDIASEMTSFYGTVSSPLLSFFSPEVLSSPSIDRQHFLFNNAHLFSLNNLRLLSNGFTLTSNIHYLTDNQQKTGTYRQSILDTFGDDIYIVEDLSSSQLQRELSSTITIEKNEPNHYLINRTDVNVAWNQKDCFIDAENLLSQKAKLPSFVIENEFSYKTAKDRWSSHLLYTWQDNSLRVSPVMLKDFLSMQGPLVQKVQNRLFDVDFGYNRKISISNHQSLELNIRPFVKQKHLASGFLYGEELINVKTDSLLNDLMRVELGTDVGIGFQYRKGSFTTYLNSAGQYLYVTRNNRVISGINRQHLFLLSPSWYAEYKKRNFTYRFDVSYRQSVSNILNDLTGYLMSSYRSIYKTTGVAPRSGKFSTDLGIHFKDIGSSFFCSLIAGYGLIHRNSLTNQIYNDIVCQSTEMKYDNHSTNWWARMELGSDIRALSSTLKLNAQVSQGKSVSLYQGRIVDYTLDALQISPSWYTLIGQVASFSYEAQYHLGRSIIDGRGNFPIHDLRQSAEVTASILKNLSIKLSTYNYYNSGLQSESSRWFAKLGISYKYKKTEWMLDWSNIFNTKEMVSYYYDDMSSYSSTYTLRPMEVLLRVKINIL